MSHISAQRMGIWHTTALQSIHDCMCLCELHLSCAHTRHACNYNPAALMQVFKTNEHTEYWNLWCMCHPKINHLFLVTQGGLWLLCDHLLWCVWMLHYYWRLSDVNNTNTVQIVKGKENSEVLKKTVFDILSRFIGSETIKKTQTPIKRPAKDFIF